MHTLAHTKQEDYGPLVGLNTFDGASLQIDDPPKVFNETLDWVTQSADAGRKWVVANDEQGYFKIGVKPDNNDPTHDPIRIDVLWGNIMAGGAGVEYYYGSRFPNNDLHCEDFRTRSNMFDQSRYALEFFSNNNIPFWDMSNENSRLSSPSTPNRCLAQRNSGDIILVHFVAGGSETIDLNGGAYTIRWFDPFANTFHAATSTITTGPTRPLSPPSSSVRGDWIALLQRDP